MKAYLHFASLALALAIVRPGLAVAALDPAAPVGQAGADLKSSPPADVSVMLKFGDKREGYPPYVLDAVRRMPAEMMNFSSTGYLDSPGDFIRLAPGLPMGVPTEVYNQDGVSITVTAGPVLPTDTAPGPYQLDPLTRTASRPPIAPAEGSVSIDYVVRVEGGAVQRGRSIVQYKGRGADLLTADGPGWLTVASPTDPSRLMALTFWMPAGTGPGEFLDIRNQPNSSFGTSSPPPGRRPGDDPTGPFTCVQRFTPASVAAELARDRALGHMAVKVKADRSGYETLDGQPLPPFMVGIKPPAPPVLGWCDEPAPPPIAVDPALARDIQLLVRIGDRLDTIPVSAVDAIRANPSERYTVSVNGWARTTDTALVKPFKALGEPVEIYNKDGLTLTATAQASNPANLDTVHIRLVARVDGQVTADSDKQGQPPLVMRGIRSRSGYTGLSMPILAAPSDGRPDRVIGVNIDWAASANLPGLDSLAAAPVFGGAISPLTDGAQPLPGAPPPTCTVRYVPMSAATVASMLRGSGIAVVRAKEDRSGYEREDGQPLAAAMADLKPAPLAPGGYCPLR